MTRLPPAPVVSDHAVLRYLERVGGIDVEALRQAIGARTAVAAALGASGVSVDGLTYVIQHTLGRPTVVTVIARASAPCRRGDSGR